MSVIQSLKSIGPGVEDHSARGAGSAGDGEQLLKFLRHPFHPTFVLKSLHPFHEFEHHQHCAFIFGFFWWSISLLTFGGLSLLTFGGLSLLSGGLSLLSAGLSLLLVVSASFLVVSASLVVVSASLQWPSGVENFGSSLPFSKTSTRSLSFRFSSISSFNSHFNSMFS